MGYELQSLLTLGGANGLLLRVLVILIGRNGG